MNQKEYITHILNDLKGIWELAEPFLKVINIVDDEKIIILFFKFLKWCIKNFSDKKAIEILEKHREKLKIYLDDEKNEYKYEKKELLELEKELEILF